MFRIISVMAIVGMLALGVYGGAAILFPSLVPMVAGLGAAATVPTQINHQGVVAINGVRFTGSGQFKFAIIDPDTGNNVWTNDGSKVPDQSGTPDTAVTLTVTDGVYSVGLGSGSMAAISPGIFKDSNLVLRLWFNDGAHDWQQLSPDHALTSTPYAMAAANGVPAGTVVSTARSTAPVGWLLCDGASVSRAAYPDLFEAIGYAYGGSGENFNLPDLRGRVIVGVDGGAGRVSANNLLANSGGEEKHTLVSEELASHAHAVGSLANASAGGHNHGGSTGGASWPNSNVYSSGGGTNFVAITWGGAYVGGDGQKYKDFAHTHGISTDGSHTHTLSGNTAATGSGTPHNVMQPYQVLNYIIRY